MVHNSALETVISVYINEEFTLKSSIWPVHGQPWYILISEPGQPFRSQFVLYCTDIGLIKQTINRPSRCNKVDVVRLYASYRCRFPFTKGAEVRDSDPFLQFLKPT